MLYVSMCNTKKNIPDMAKTRDVEEWVRVCKDELLHKKCKSIKCYETMDIPHKLMIIIDTKDAEVLNLLSRDFGDEWNLETFALHEIPELLEEDHSIVAG